MTGGGVQQPQISIVAFDTQTGDISWTAPFGQCNCIPRMMGVDGRDNTLVLSLVRRPERLISQSPVSIQPPVSLAGPPL